MENVLVLLGALFEFSIRKKLLQSSNNVVHPHEIDNLNTNFRLMETTLISHKLMWKSIFFSSIEFHWLWWSKLHSENQLFGSFSHWNHNKVEQWTLFFLIELSSMNDFFMETILQYNALEISIMAHFVQQRSISCYRKLWTRICACKVPKEHNFQQ